MSTLELGTLQAELGALAQINVGGFTLVTVTADYSLLSEGSGAGSVTFTLTQPISNGGVTIVCAPLVVDLDVTGSLSVVLPAADDTGTVPPGIWYGVTEEITGAQPRDAFIFVSAAGPSTRLLADLMPATPPWR